MLAGGVHHNFAQKSTEVPLMIQQGKNSRLWDVDGNEYLDLHAKFGALILGHNNKEYNESLKECIDQAAAVEMTEATKPVCAALQSLIPCCDLVRFGLSGTEMMQNAIRLARAYTGKNRILRFEGHFHGTADNVLGGEVTDIDFPVPKDLGKGPFTTAGRAQGALSNEMLLIPWNDAELLERILWKYKDEIAAVITEPILINGGSILPEPGFLATMRRLCRENQVLLIFDELITGFRVGPGGAQKMFGVIPDLCILGKALSNGSVPLSAIAGRGDIMRKYEKALVIHGGTYNGYPLGMAAANATLHTIMKGGDELYSTMKRKTEEIHLCLIQAARDCSLDLVVQGDASCSSFHCALSPVACYRDMLPSIQMKNGILRQCLASYGILTASVSRILPTLFLSDDDVRFFKERCGYAIRDAKVLIERMKKKYI